MPLAATLFGALLTVAASMACGRLLLKGTTGDPGIVFVTGAAVLSLGVFLLCAAGIAYPLVFLALGAVPLILTRGNLAVPGKSTGLPRAVQYGVGLLFGAYLFIYLSQALAPEASPDGTAYHLSLVARYLREHGFHRITTNIYASLSQGVEMLFLMAFAFGKHSAAATVHLAFLLALAWQIFRYAADEGFPAAGACAAFLVFASPLVGSDAASAYNDVAVAAIVFTLFYLLQIWDRDRNPRLLAAIGLVAGFGFAAKYTAVVAVPYALGYVGWKSRRLRDLLVVAGCATLLMAPWLVKNWLWVQNPVSPFLNSYFPNPYVTPEFEKEYSGYLLLYDLRSRWQIPMQVTTYGALTGVLGPIFLLAPVGLLALRLRQGRRLLLAALVFGATYFLNIGARFLIPPLPFLALALTLGVSALPAAALAMVALHAALSWPAVVPLYARQDAWKFGRIPWREALGLRDRDTYVLSKLPDYAGIRLIETATPPGSRIFSFEPVPESYTSRTVLVDYYSAENRVTGRIVKEGMLPEYAPTLRLRFAFDRRALRGVRVVQTTNGAGLWNVHEFRIFDGARELPRASDWQLRSRPFPWGVQNAFDNSPVTFWIAGDTLEPGMYVGADFQKDESVNAVVLETEPNLWNARFQLQGETAAGQWKLLTRTPEISEQSRPAGLEQAVSAELKRRGIGYLLLFDRNDGADSLRRNASLWGVELVGHYRQAWLYKLL